MTRPAEQSAVERLYRIDGLSSHGNWIPWKSLKARSLKAARREFAEWLKQWTPEGRAMFKLVRVTTTVREWPS